MSIEEIREVVTDFFKKFQAGDSAGALTYLNNDAVWMQMGNVMGKMNKEQVGGLIGFINLSFPNQLKLTTTDWTIQGNRAAVEVESYGVKNDGKIYNNVYHFLFQFKGEKIVVIKEYMDTLHVAQTFS